MPQVHTHTLTTQGTLVLTLLGHENLLVLYSRAGVREKLKEGKPQTQRPTPLLQQLRGSPGEEIFLKKIFIKPPAPGISPGTISCVLFYAPQGNVMHSKNLQPDFRELSH